MKRTSKTIVFFLAIFTLSWIATGNAATQYVGDSNTILLDHFNGSTLANYTGGAPAYVDSVPGLNQAINFTSGTYLRYDLASWNSSAGGTIEAWVNPSVNPKGLATFQWSNTTSQPSSGYIGHWGLQSDGKLSWSVWNWGASGGLISNSIIPLNQWSHIASTWGPSGSDFYLNGQHDAHTDTNAYPEMMNPLYVYLNYWGLDNGSFVIDELRISNIARTEFTTVPLPPSVLLLGSGLLGLVGLRRFRKV